MRTQKEIKERHERTGKSFMNFEPEVLIDYLDYETAKSFLRPEITEEQFNASKLNQLGTREAILSEARAYMKEYGWPKCQDHRGISASRTLQKMEAWVWLAGDDDLIDKIRGAPYAQYGAPTLKVICEHYGWPIPDDEATKRMMRGLPCTPGCDMGCGL